jgi:hypothetical protein
MSTFAVTNFFMIFYITYFLNLKVQGWLSSR